MTDLFNNLTIILPIWGNYCLVESSLALTLDEVRKFVKKGTSAIIILDGSSWNNCPLIQVFQQKCPQVIIEVREERCDIPGVLMNMAIKKTSTDFVCFTWPGCQIPIEAYGVMLNELQNQKAIDAISGSPPVDIDPAESLVFGTMLAGLIPSLNSYVFRVKTFKELPLNFSEATNDQRASSYFALIQLARLNRIIWQQVDPFTKRWDLFNYPYLRTNPISDDELHRTLCAASTPEANSTNPCALPLKKYPSEPMRIAVTGGLWDHTHAQLCFFNYFETKIGKEKYSWKYLLSERVTTKDIEGADLLIICRGRHKNITSIIDYCIRHSIPTLYMIDDNWITVGKDWPVYEKLFSPASPDYQVFMDALRRCDATLVYSSILADHIEPYAKSLLKLTVNINDLKTADSDPQFILPGKRRKFRIGYTGSARFSEAGFVSIKKIADLYKDVEIIFMSTALPEILKPLAIQNRLEYIPYRNYHQYRIAIRQINVDVLLAPLDRCPTSYSKCPNKYLEITAAGAVGVYSNCDPYASVIKNLQNGILVDDDYSPDEAWDTAIKYSYENRDTLAQMYLNAEQDILINYATSSRQQEFDLLIKKMMKRTV